MLVVSNTSPICNLAIIGRLELLRLQFGEILIPPAVKIELNMLRDANARKAIDTAKLAVG